LALVALDITSAFDPWWALLETLDDFETVITPGVGAVLYSGAYEKTDLPQNLHAAAAATALRLSSLDYAKRTYATGARRESITAARLYVAAFKSAMSHMDEVAPHVISESDGKEVLGEFAGAIALNRVKSGFRAANLLYRVGYNYEGDAVARQVLEQIAWAIAVRRCTTQAQIRKIEPQSSMGALKAVHPEAARLNGTLSNIAHAGLARHQEAFHTDGDDRPRVRLAWNRLSESARNLLLLSDAWVVAFELSQFNYLTKRISIDNSDPPTMRPDRAFTQEIGDMVAAIAKLEMREAAAE